MTRMKKFLVERRDITTKVLTYTIIRRKKYLYDMGAKK